jgi:hypothetical protein
MILDIGLLFLLTSSAMILRYDPKDARNAIMLFLQDNPLSRLLLVMQLREIGLLIFLYGVFMACRIL